MKRDWIPYLGAVILAFAVIAILAQGFRESTTIVIEESPVATSTLPGATVIEESLPAAVATAPKPLDTKKLDAAVLAAGNAAVNILCTTSGSPYKPISGSGVFIDSKGVILTAAHIGQYFLLKDYPKKDSIRCVVRAGSPAKDAYIADLLYVSTHWVTANQGTLAEARPTGTGESDFALLYVTGSVSRTPLPPSFPALALSSSDAHTGDTVVLAAYGAEFIAAADITRALPLIVDGGVVERVYTFGEDTIDLLSIEGSNTAQEGSSGGAAVSLDGKLIGLITTSSDEVSLDARHVRAITPRHIRKAFELDAGMRLEGYLGSAPLADLAAAFGARAESLKRLLIEATSD